MRIAANCQIRRWSGIFRDKSRPAGPYEFRQIETIAISCCSAILQGDMLFAGIKKAGLLASDCITLSTHRIVTIAMNADGDDTT